MVVAVDDGGRIVRLEVALESPIVGKTEREQCIGFSHCVERNDVSAIMSASDPCKRGARYRMKIRELNWIAHFGP
jgi:hypothetical protein